MTRNETPKTRRARHKTFVCMGVMRGGTSAVAGLMQRLGIFMGHDLPNNYEDPRFVRPTLEDLEAVIAERNARHNVWGWKNPDAAGHVDRVAPMLRNPHLIIVYRDLVATMRAQARWHARGSFRAAQEILLMHHRNWFLIERTEYPVMMVSYEKLLLAPDLFVREMADFLCVPRPRGAALEELAAFLAPGSYK